jgi:ketosteroid isomerase-like protein
MIKSIIKQLVRLDNFILSAIFLFMLASCSNDTKKETTVSTNDLIAAANELDSLFLVAFNNGDADAIMKLHWNSPDLCAYPPGEIQVKGFDAVKAGYVRDFASSKGAKLEYTSTNNIPFTDGVVGHGTFRWTMPIEGGSPMVFDGRYSEVKAFKDGKMVIILDHTSMPMPPPPSDSTQKK